MSRISNLEDCEKALDGAGRQITDLWKIIRMIEAGRTAVREAGKRGDLIGRLKERVSRKHAEIVDYRDVIGKAILLLEAENLSGYDVYDLVSEMKQAMNPPPGGRKAER